MKFRVCRIQRTPNANGVGFKWLFTLPLDTFVFDDSAKAFEHLNKPKTFAFADNKFWVQQSEDGKAWEEAPTIDVPDRF